MNIINNKSQLQSQYNEIKAKGLNLDMSRGKPSPDAVAFSKGLIGILAGDDCISDGIDCCNYGVLDGLPEAKKMLAPMLGVSPNNLIIGGNSSLAMMYNTLIRAMVMGVDEDSKPWSSFGEKIKFLCPVPGYDRHFSICENFGIEMISIPTDKGDVDMDLVENLVSKDAAIKGMWCVPIYANPSGITYSDETVRRLASMKTKAEDFRLFWDCAYIIHHLCDKNQRESILNILDECQKAGNPDRAYMFASTSKITIPSAGLAIMAASERNIAFIKKQMGFQTIGSDKLNQLRHVRFFNGDFNNIVKHMELMKNILKPKFDAANAILEREITPLGLGEWLNPKGGYFISFNGNCGTASKTVQLCKEAGVVLTEAGASFPYGKDPDDRNIRIAPSFPPLDELCEAMEVFCLCVKLANAD